MSENRQMLTEQVRELLQKSKETTEPLPNGTNLVPVMSLMTTQEQQYVRQHIGMIAVEIDGQIHFVQQSTYVPPHPRTTVQRSAETGMPVGMPTVAGG